MVIQPLYNHKVEQPKSRKPRYLLAALLNTLLLYFVINLPHWNFSFIKPSWNEVVVFASFSLIINLVMHLVFLVYDDYRFYFLTKTGLDVIGIIVLYKIYTVWPFNFALLASNKPWLGTSLVTPLSP